MLQQVSEKLLGQFVESLEAKLAAENAGSTASPADTGQVASGKEQTPAWPVNPVPGTDKGPLADPKPIDLLELAGGDLLKKFGAAAAALVAVAGADLGAAQTLVNTPLLLRGVDLAAFAAAPGGAPARRGSLGIRRWPGDFRAGNPTAGAAKPPRRFTGPPGSLWSTGGKTSVSSTR